MLTPPHKPKSPKAPKAAAGGRAAAAERNKDKDEEAKLHLTVSVLGARNLKEGGERGGARAPTAMPPPAAAAAAARCHARSCVRAPPAAAGAAVSARLSCNQYRYKTQPARRAGKALAFAHASSFQWHDVHESHTLQVRPLAS
eukprot:303089-Prymnesium_polylepis.2